MHRLEGAEHLLQQNRLMWRCRDRRAVRSDAVYSPTQTDKSFLCAEPVQGLACEHAQYGSECRDASRTVQQQCRATAKHAEQCSFRVKPFKRGEKPLNERW